jgi:hypothetical protein
MKALQAFYLRPRGKARGVWFAALGRLWGAPHGPR